MKFLCEQCKAKYQIADEKAAGKTVRMKCRKCGYLIEVRAAATETSGAGGSSSQPPASGRSSRPPPAPAARPSPPRAAPRASGLPGKAPARPGDRPGGPLASAMKSALTREEEVSAPVDMSDLSPGDEWYVAINGVPVGPIRIAEVRRKAAIGAVTEESLCWQEGLDEWRALRSFPELAAIVREAFSSGRSSLTPQAPDVRSSTPPPARTSMRPSASSGPAGSAGPASPAGVPPRPAPGRVSTNAPLAAARSNVVPITSRLATAEKLAEPVDDMTRPFTGTLPGRMTPLPAAAVVPDPFGSPPPRAAMAVPTGPAFGAPPDASSPFAPARSPSISLASIPAGVPAKKSTQWMAIAMVAAAIAFGVTAGIAVFFRPSPQPTPVVVQVPGAAPVAPTATAAATAPTETPGAAPTGSAAAATTRTAVAMGSPAKTASPGAATTAAAAPAHGPLNLQGLTGTTIAPTEEPGGGNEAPKAPGQCLSEGQVSQVIGMHSVGLRRACWERSTSQKQTANITVSLTIGGDGAAQGVSASGDDSAVASCIANDVKNWHFPAMGCSQRTAIPFHFVRQ
ncbi:MAG TPA: GYF domain-containing protein [Polyangiaceae bacterium]